MSRRTDLPDMPLCNGCGACCGPVSARPDEIKRIKRYTKDHDIEWKAPELQEGTISFACGFLRPQDDGSFNCAIHAVRPWLCRAFGVIDEMPCPVFPEAPTISFPSRNSVRLRLVDEKDRYLGEYFEEGYLKRIGGRELGPALRRLAADAMRRNLIPGLSGQPLSPLTDEVATP